MSVRNTLGHLLPKSFPWNLTYDRSYVQFVTGVTPALDDARSNFDAVWQGLSPATSTGVALESWERQWALWSSSSLTLSERQTRLAAVWAALGGQAPKYITDTLQSHGFPVYTHEWWTLDLNGYPVARDPRDHLKAVFGGTDTDGLLLVNRTRTAVKFDEIGCGEPWAECGEPRAVCGYFGGYAMADDGYSYVGDYRRHPYYLYIGGATFPDVVNLPAARRDEFEYLCQKICPAQQWLVLRVRYV